MSCSLCIRGHANGCQRLACPLQEETTFLGIPCLTVRENTERPVTVEMGTNIVVGRDTERPRAEVRQILAGNSKKGRVPPLWDGHAAERIARVICGIAFPG